MEIEAMVLEYLKFLKESKKWDARFDAMMEIKEYYDFMFKVSAWRKHLDDKKAWHTLDAVNNIPNSSKQLTISYE